MDQPTERVALASSRSSSRVCKNKQPAIHQAPRSSSRFITSPRNTVMIYLTVARLVRERFTLGGRRLYDARAGWITVMPDRRGQ